MSVLPVYDLDFEDHYSLSPISLELRKSLFDNSKLTFDVRPGKVKTDTVIISDIHLGSDVSRGQEMLEVLRSWFPFRRLIILGDLFEDLNLANLTDSDFAVIDELRRLSNMMGVEVHWIEGNHDLGGHDLVERLIGCRTHTELVLDLFGKSYLLMHGHQFDQFMNRHPIISGIASNIYVGVQTREGLQRNFSRWLKKKSKQWLKVCNKVQQLAVNHAEGYGVDYIMCGHTHYFDDIYQESDAPIQYINTGCWTDYPSTITTIDEDGLQQHSYH